MPSSADVLKANGLLSQVIEGFIPRDPQLKMAEAIEEAIFQQTSVVIEAGTGTGKTFGYLVPALLAQKKTIISTGTKNLQEQLFFKDLPAIKKALSRVIKVVLLKGRSNYLCWHRLERNQTDGRFGSKQVVEELQSVSFWSKLTDTGEITELENIPEDSSVWPLVTSTVENCLNQECAFYHSCFVVKARQQALSADIVVVNHHLFFADLLLQEEGFGELLPGADLIILDEAHHLPDIASLFYSTVLTSRQLQQLARDTDIETLKTARDMQGLLDASLNLQRAIQAMRVALGQEVHARPWPEAFPQNLNAAIAEMTISLCELEKWLKQASTRSKEFDNCWKRAGYLIAKFNLINQPIAADTVKWYETHPQSFSIHVTPLVVSEHFKKHLHEKARTWVFTSATLAVKDNFNLFTKTLGLQGIKELQLESPFDYSKQALLYVPRGLPDAHDRAYTEALIAASLPVLEASAGKAFILFTSHRAVDAAYHFLKDRIAFPLLRQGTKPKRALIEEFKALGNAVLLGTSSFWYGVDVRGDALTCVIIDKLPFASPDDPLLQAKIKSFRKQGNDPFYSYQLPHAVLTLKQGAGRLIRDTNDRGVLMIGDPRLVGARYAEVFLQSLPNMGRTREIDKVKEFLSS